MVLPLSPYTVAATSPIQMQGYNSCHNGVSSNFCQRNCDVTFSGDLSTHENTFHSCSPPAAAARSAVKAESLEYPESRFYPEMATPFDGQMNCTPGCELRSFPLLSTGFFQQQPYLISGVTSSPLEQFQYRTTPANYSPLNYGFNYGMPYVSRSSSPYMRHCDVETGSLCNACPAPDVQSRIMSHNQTTFNIFSKPGGRASTKQRSREKYRVVYSSFQRLELEKEYCFNRFITIDRRAHLAQMLGLTTRQVKIWFQNRRAKERKIQMRSDVSQKSLAQNISAKPLVDSSSSVSDGNVPTSPSLEQL